MGTFIGFKQILAITKNPLDQGGLIRLLKEALGVTVAFQTLLDIGFYWFQS